MRSLVAILLLACAASAAGVESVTAPDGDIEKYDPLRPPPLFLKNVYVDDIDTKTFILVEGALLVPDRVRLVEGRDAYTFEVVDDEELARFEPVVRFRLPEVYDVGAETSSGRRLIRFEQKMWRKGLHLAFREYEIAEGETWRYKAFRVTFETCGQLYSATLTLYKSKADTGQLFDAAGKQLEKILDELGRIRQEIDQAGRRVSAAFDDLKKNVAAVEKHEESLDKQLQKLNNQITTLEGKINRLSRRVVALDKRVK